jgi:hypothetical protein
MARRAKGRERTERWKERGCLEMPDCPEQKRRQDELDFQTKDVKFQKHRPLLTSQAKPRQSIEIDEDQLTTSPAIAMPFKLTARIWNGSGTARRKSTSGKPSPNSLQTKPDVG